ncbi:MAG: DUF2975 domain-containing protein [Clostridia bacterium]|nr:DUF2975 domain-containing protein [Clostridia bacterium]
MKRSEKSLNLTIILLVALSILFAFMLFMAPSVFTAYCEADNTSEAARKTLIGVFYGCTPSAILTLVFLFKLLFNIKKGEVFCTQTVRYINILSYTCLSVVPLSLPLCYFFLAGFPIPMAAGFMWLFFRVLKNAFERGSEIKNENDLTV